MTRGDDAAGQDAAGPPLRWFVVQRAIYTLLSDGISPSFANIGKEIGIAKQNVWKFFRRHPGFMPWLTAQMAAENEQMLAVLARRHFHIGMQGSVPSADFFAKAISGHYARSSSSDGPGGGVNVQPVLNLLIPRPEMPAIAHPPALPASTVPANVPRVNVR